MRPRRLRRLGGALRAHPPAVEGIDTVVRFEADGGAPSVARFLLPPGLTAAAGADAAATAGWLPAMVRAEPLVVDGPVSPRLLAGLDRYADVLLAWDRQIHPTPKYHRVTVDATAATATAPAPGRGTACFFTGGVDSFHSVLRRRDELDALVFVHGFDLGGDDDEPLNRQVAARLHDAAASIGLPLLEVCCNLHAFGDEHGIVWGDFHGAALATVAHLLADRFSTFLVPATTTYGRLYPLGSHPLLDPLWSSERVELVHDGADATRVDKLRLLAGEPSALRHLRVCSENRGGAYNCGRCEKCVRTAVGIRIAGVEGRFETLPAPSLRDIAAVEISGLGSTWLDYREELDRTGANPRLRRAIELALLRRDLDRRRRRRRRRKGR